MVILYGGNMKRKDILQKLAKAGFTFEEGGSHTKVLKEGNYISAVSRQTEISIKIVRKIEKQTGVQLLN